MDQSHVTHSYNEGNLQITDVNVVFVYYWFSFHQPTHKVEHHSVLDSCDLIRLSDSLMYYLSGLLDFTRYIFCYMFCYKSFV